MARIKVAIACQGGGSQTAFTAGALKGLVENWDAEQFQCVSISGTSGGAVCAALLWYSFCKGETPLHGRLMDFWADNTAQGWAEESFNGMIMQSLRMVNSGLVPSFQLSPSAPVMGMMMSYFGAGCRQSFTDFPMLLKKHIDFDELASWGPRADGPVLVIGAANVSSGKLVKFSSLNEAIQLEHILASCAVPSIFPAVQLGDDGYWDGLFSDNPPVEDLIRIPVVGEKNIPEEIWLIKINPTESSRVPVDISHIIDRRNQIEGNISLLHQLQHLEFINDLVVGDAFRPEFLSRFNVKAPIRIPNCFDAAVEKPYHIPHIQVPKELESKLNYEGKIDRSASNIGWLVETGEIQARTFLSDRRQRVANS